MPGQQGFRGHGSKEGIVGLQRLEQWGNGEGPVGSVSVECGLPGLHPGHLPLSHTHLLFHFLSWLVFPSSLQSSRANTSGASLSLFLEFAQEVTPAFLFRFLLRHQCFPGEAQEQGVQGKDNRPFLWVACPMSLMCSLESYSQI